MEYLKCFWNNKMEGNKHRKICLLVRIKLNSLENKIFKALIEPYISHVETALVTYEE